MRQIKKFTEEEKKYIIENYPFEQTYKMIEKLGCSKKKLSSFVEHLGIKKDVNYKPVRPDGNLTREQKEYVLKNYSNKTDRELAKECDCPVWVIAVLAKRNDLKKESPICEEHNIFTYEQRKFILENYETMLTSEISERLKVSANAIRAYAFSHGIRRDYNKCPMMVENKDGLSLEQKRFIIENYATMSNDEISEKIGATWEQIHSYSNNRKLKKNFEVSKNISGYFEYLLDKRARKDYLVKNYLGTDIEPKIESSSLYHSKYGKFFVNQDYFEKIDNEWKAYWLGFLYADGCVIISNRNGKHKNVLQLNLKESDSSHVQKFADSLQSDAPVKICETNYKDKKSARLLVTNKKICEDLCRLGCVPRKSLILTFPQTELIPKELLKHFIRGYFEGDGCISVSKERKYTRINIIGTKEFLDGLNNYLKSEVGIFTGSFSQKKGNKAFALQFGGYREVEKFYQHFYKNCNIFLDRKLEKFDTVFCLE